MANASLTSHYHGQTSGTNTSLVVASVVVAAGDRVLVEVDAVSAGINLTSVVLGSAALTRIRNWQGHTHKRELWVLDVPTAGTFSCTITAPSAVKMGAAVLCIADAASFLTFFHVRANWYENEFGVPSTVFAGQIQNDFAGAALAVSVMASTINNQTFTVNIGTSKFEDDTVATTDVHLAAASDAVAVGVEQSYKMTLGTADDWSGSVIIVRSGTGPSASVGVPVLGTVTSGDDGYNHVAVAGQALYLIIHALGSTTAPSAVTYNGVAMVQQFGENFAALSHHYLSVWSLVGVSSGSAAIAITSSGTINSVAFNVLNGPPDGQITAVGGRGSNGSLTAQVNAGGFMTDSLCIGYTAVDSETVTVTAGATGLAEADAPGYRQGLVSATGNGGVTLLGFSFGLSREHADVSFAIPSADEPVSGGSYQILPLTIASSVAGPRPYIASILSRTIRFLHVKLSAAPGVGKSRKVTLYVNGLATAFEATVADAATSASFDASDRVIYGYALAEFLITDAGSPTASNMEITYEQELGRAGLSHYGGSTRTAQFASSSVGTGVRKNPLVQPDTNWGSSTDHYGIVGANGTLVETYLPYQVELLSGDEYEDFIFLSRPVAGVHSAFVKQDGSPGTIDTRTVITGGTSSTLGTSRANRRYALPLQVGDLFYHEAKAVSGAAFPTGMLGLRLYAYVAFQADTNGEFMFCALGSNLNSGGTVSYEHPQGFDEDTTEANVEQTLGTLSTGFDVRGVTADVDTVPGGTATWAAKTRKNGANGAATATITAAINEATGAGTSSYVAGDRYGSSVVAANAPAGSGNYRVALRGFMTPIGAVTPTGFEAVTQLVGFVGYSEDAEDDDPPTVSDCTGGGTVATGTNPTDGASLATASALHAWFEATIGATTYRWSQTAINVTTAKEPRIAAGGWGRCYRGLPDERGGFQAVSVTIRLIDGDNLLRTLHSTQTLKGVTGKVYVADEATIRAAGNPQIRFSGVVSDFRPVQGGYYDLTLEDPLSILFSAEASETLLPPDLISISDGTADQGLRASPAPVLYGSLSDEDEADPQGTIEAPFIGTETVAGHVALGNLHKHLICISPTHNVQSVFLADPASGNPPLRRAKAGASLYGTELYVPHQPGWFLAVDYSVEDSKRWTFLYLDQSHPAAQLAREGRIPITVNVCGREHVGDATGNTITNPARVGLHALNTLWAQAVGDIDWPAMATRDTFSVFDTTAWAAVGTICTARGYVWAFMLGHSYKQITFREFLELIPICGDYEPFINRFGQCSATMVDRTSTYSSAASYTAVFDILRDSFEIDPKTDAIENAIRYVYKRKYVTTLEQPTPVEGSRLYHDSFQETWVSGLQEDSDATSITDLGGAPKGRRESRVLEMEFVRDAATAVDLAAQRKALRKSAKGRAEASFNVTLMKADTVELGDIVKVTHPQGLGASGWSALRCQVRGIEEDWNDMTVRLTVRDVDNLLA